MTGPRWQVEIVHPVDGKPKVWDSYADRERAQEVAAMLRKHGLWSQVRRVDGEVEAPEHHGGRSAFVIWAVMCGFASPERLTERVLAEVDFETEGA